MTTVPSTITSSAIPNELSPPPPELCPVTGGEGTEVLVGCAEAVAEGVAVAPGCALALGLTVATGEADALGLGEACSHSILNVLLWTLSSASRWTLKGPVAPSKPFTLTVAMTLVPDLTSNGTPFRAEISAPV